MYQDPAFILIDPILKILFLTAENMFEKTGLDMQATGRFVRTGLDICTLYMLQGDKNWIGYAGYWQARTGLDLQATGK